MNVFVASALTVLVLVGCGAPDATLLGDAAYVEGDSVIAIGSVELAVQYAGDLSLNRLEWRIEGNGFSDSGELVVTRRAVASARLGGIPVGEGYTLRLSSTDPALSCAGVATFGVRRASTTTVRAEVQCTLTATTGQISLVAPINVCPVVTGLSAVPFELELGDRAELWADVLDVDSGPRALSVRWESEASTFVSNGTSAAVTCTALGQLVVRVFASDGACEGSAALALQCVVAMSPRLEWPGAPEVETVDPTGTFVENISGAAYLPGEAGAADTLWVVQNGPSRIIPLFPEVGGDGFVLATSGPWRAGKQLTYPNDRGEPDTEDVTFAAAANVAYVVAERDNTRSGTSRLSVLRFELDADDAVLSASHEWNVTAQLPKVGANTGLEAIAWISDDFLVAGGFFDERTSAAYDPSAYPAHAAGLFFVGVEADGMVYAFALNHDSGEASRVASFSSGQAHVMGLDFDRDTGLLWTLCDDGCQGEMTVLGLGPTRGAASQQRFQVKKAFSRPGMMPNINNEGLAIAPNSECNLALKHVYWVDDGSTGGHSVRSGLMPCGAP